MSEQRITVRPDDIITVPEAARRLGKHKVTLYRWVDAGILEATRLGGILFVNIADIERLKKGETGASETPVSREVSGTQAKNTDHQTALS